MCAVFCNLDYHFSKQHPCDCCFPIFVSGPPNCPPNGRNKLCFQSEFASLRWKTGLKRSQIGAFYRWPANLLCGDGQNRAFDALPPSFISTTVQILCQRRILHWNKGSYQVLLKFNFRIGSNCCRERNFELAITYDQYLHAKERVDKFHKTLKIESGCWC